MPESSQKPRRILFLDDEQSFLDCIRELFLAWSQGTWEIDVANSATRALEILKEHAPDLVVIDLQMPVVDGLQFIDLLNRKYPTLRKVVLSGHPSQHSRESSRQKGVELYLEKPNSREHFETVFATLNELASLKAQEGFVGVLRQAGLQDILQMECLARNSSILEVSTHRQRGRIYIDKGSIVHAELGAVTGISAFNALLCLRGGEFNLKPFAAPPEQTINGQWEFLVMEAARMRDEMSEIPATGEMLSEAAAIVPFPTTSSPVQEELPAVTADSEAEEKETQIEEYLVCSGRGEVLYDWQCKDIESRLQLLQYTKQKARMLSELLPLGQFDRVEILGPEGRTVILLASDRKLFMRSRPISTELPS